MAADRILGRVAAARVAVTRRGPARRVKSWSLPRNLFGVAAARRVQREILGAPTSVEQQLDLVVADTHRIVRSAGHEPHSWALAPEEPHRVVDERLEGGGDLAGLHRLWSRISDTTRHPR